MIGEVVEIDGKPHRVLGEVQPRLVHIGHPCDRYEATYARGEGTRRVVVLEPIEETP